MECKYWLDRENFAIEEAYSYNMGNRDKREVEKIIFEYFEFIETEWDRFQNESLKLKSSTISRMFHSMGRPF